ncbi:aminotransferase class IV [Streptomyces physcomitrii]|uniref:aminotransferase class IV n=1 Tax=Streptomyces physcomitrii TaxID=2724184 RepID=UPI00342C823B
MLPFDRRTGQIWYDGSLVDWSEATLHVLSHGLHYASSIFEGIRVYRGEPFLLDHHLDRLAASARILDFTLEYDRETLREAAREVVDRAQITEGYLRVNAWRGSEIIQTAALHTSVHTSLAAWELPAGYYAAADALDTGVRLVTGRYRRPSPEYAPVKSKAAGNYMIGTVSKNEALRAGYDDALLLDDRGNFVEATGAHLFFLKDGALHTPTTRCTIDGITRAAVLALAAHRGVETVVGDLPPAFAQEAEGAFLCGTACEVLPVASIDGHGYQVRGNTLLRSLVDDYRALVEGRLDVAVENPWAPVP